jgi:hypothetical protein
MKVPGHSPLVFLVKVNLRESKAFGGREGRAMRNGARKEVQKDLTAFDRNVEI